jgi:rhodanese-related sulfurtransferase
MEGMNPHEIPSTTVDQLPDPLPADLVVLDVREDHEWEAGHVEGAVHVPLGEVPERAGELDPQKRTLVVCHLGGRSARATAYLQQLGHDVVNLDGGMDAWQAAGRPTV